MRVTLPWAACIAALSCGEAGAPDLVVDRIELSSPAVTVGPATTVQMYAVPRTATGREVPGRTIVWSGGHPSVATISATGLVSAIGIGTTTLSASADGKSASADVTVIPTQPAHLASKWKMDSFDAKPLPAAYQLFYNEPVGDRVVGVVEIRLDSAIKTMTTLNRYQRTYYFTELHDGVVQLKYLWGDHGQVTLGAGAPVPVSMVSEYIQNLSTAGVVRLDAKLALNEELWISESKRATIWSRR